MKLNSLSVIKIMSMEEDVNSLQNRISKTKVESSKKIKGGCHLYRTEENRERKMEKAVNKSHGVGHWQIICC